MAASTSRRRSSSGPAPKGWWLAVEWQPAPNGSIPWQVVTLAKYLPKETYRALLHNGQPVVQFIFRKEHMHLVSAVLMMFDADRTKYFESGEEIPHAKAIEIMKDPTRWA